MHDLTHARLKELLYYDPATGIFTWLKPTSNRVKVGAIAGGLDTWGYVRLNVDGRNYQGHILAWFYMTGEWPEEDIDHRDRSRANNAWANLREASRSQNNANAKCPRHNTSGFKGVTLDKRSGLWVAQIMKDGRNNYLGQFDAPERAHAAYVAKAREFFGEFARPA